VTLAYLDASAFVKTIVVEPESRRLVDWLKRWPDRASCAILRTEAVRAVRRYGLDVVAATREEFRGLTLVEVDETLLDAAADLSPQVSSLDAIHLAAAQSLGPDLGVLVTYDIRMISAAGLLSIETAAP
jgi:uncharacterized protein